MIAVVDDEEFVCKALVRMLCAAGLPARGYGSGHEFLRSWHFDRPDCLLLDLQMPGLSGIEVHDALKQAGAHFPVVMFSAHDAPDVRDECLNNGVAGYLCKPVDSSVLIEALKSAIATPH